MSDSAATVLICSFCSTELQKPASKQFRIPSPLPPAHPVATQGLVRVGNVPYRVHGRLAQGKTCDVFLARRDAALTEMVVLKVARDQHNEHVTAEWKAIRDLRLRVGGTFLEGLLPSPVAFEIARYGHEERTAAIYRWRSGFQFTFEDARAEYRSGVDPRAVVWMWNRLLEQLGCLHQLGYSHGAIEPAHLLLHPRDHGLVLCGWSHCSRGTGPDVAMSASAIASLLGSAAPKPLLELTRRAERYTDAFKLKEELKGVAFAAFGPPRFHHFRLGQ